MCSASLCRLAVLAPRSVHSGSGRNTESDTCVSGVQRCVCISGATYGGQNCQCSPGREICFIASPPHTSWGFSFLG